LDMLRHEPRSLCPCSSSPTLHPIKVFLPLIQYDSFLFFTSTPSISLLDLLRASLFLTQTLHPILYSRRGRASAGAAPQTAASILTTLKTTADCLPTNYSCHKSVVVDLALAYAPTCHGVGQDIIPPLLCSMPNLFLSLLSLRLALILSLYDVSQLVWKNTWLLLLLSCAPLS
jgi:hypothetical protein